MTSGVEVFTPMENEKKKKLLKKTMILYFSTAIKQESNKLLSRVDTTKGVAIVALHFHRSQTFHLKLIVAKMMFTQVFERSLLYLP